MDGAAQETRTEYWQSKDIHDHGGSWRLKVDTITMDVLVCMAGVPCPFNGHPDELPGQTLIDGQRWVSEFVAALTLLTLDRLQDLIELEMTSTEARLEAMEWLRQQSRKVAEMEAAARRHHENAAQALQRTRARLGLTSLRPSGKLLPS